MKKIIGLIVGVAILLALSLGLYGIWKLLLNPSSQYAPKSAVPSEPITTETYNGSAFSFQYPSNFVVMDNNTNPETQGEILLSVQMDGTQDSIPWGAMGISTPKTSGLESVLSDIYNVSGGQTWTNPMYQVRYTRLEDMNLANGVVAHVYQGTILGDDSQSNILRIINHHNTFYIFNQVVNTGDDLQEGDLEYQVPFDQIFFDIFSSLKFN